MKKQNVVLGVLLVAVLVVGANFPRQGGTVVERVIEKVGASAGPDVFVHTRFFDGMTDGGGVYSSTTGATIAAGTVSSAIMKKNKVLRFGGPFSAAFTLTLPASTTMGDVLERPGDSRTWIIENTNDAAATTTTIAAGAGMDLQEPDGQNVVIGINNYAFLTCYRELSTDIVCMVDETIPAD